MRTAVVQQQSGPSRLQGAAGITPAELARKVVSGPAVHGVSYAKPNEHLNHEAFVLGFCSRTAEHRYPHARIAPHLGVPEFSF